jgi:hypothetical protein
MAGRRDPAEVIQMDRRGHALQGMDRVYMHVTHQMRGLFDRMRALIAKRPQRS